ncbi:hypothetical protein QL285_081829 [Trifolium repens]|nr:hypothetical protein QL285_081825 [Trifolium repens]KAK2368648.1 hypothetical protein QL285_081829 [Trifolium repens]
MRQIKTVSISKRKLTRIRVLPKQKVGSRLQRDSNLLHKGSEITKLLRKLNWNVPLTIQYVIINSRRDMLADMSRNIIHLRQRRATPRISPEIYILTIAKKPDRVVKNCRKFIFHATP